MTIPELAIERHAVTDIKIYNFFAFTARTNVGKCHKKGLSLPGNCMGEKWCTLDLSLK